MATMRAHVCYQCQVYADLALTSIAELRRLGKRGSEQAVVELARRGIYSGRQRFRSVPYPPRPKPPTPSANSVLAPQRRVMNHFREHQERLRQQEARDRDADQGDQVGDRPAGTVGNEGDERGSGDEQDHGPVDAGGPAAPHDQ